MNRIILIGNGFDLAHGLPTRYEHFMDWYWGEWEKILRNSHRQEEVDVLCSFRLASDDKSFVDFLKRFKPSFEYVRKINFISELKKISTCVIEKCPFLELICKSVETKGWVDIENEYYKLLTSPLNKERYNGRIIKVKDLNEQLQFLREKLENYLSCIDINTQKGKEKIKNIIYSPINHCDISVSGVYSLVEHVNHGLICSDNELIMKLGLYGYSHSDIEYLNEFRKGHDYNDSLVHTYLLANKYPEELLLPNEIMLLNFNYTNTASLYLPITKPGFEINHIHGELSKPNSIIFGYGDELDENYSKISNLNDNEYLKNFKSIKYLESDRYRKALQFMDAAPYQVFIMGHSCGNSDRTFLNTLFEHKNCVSIKPYYHKRKDGKDNYLDIVQNISRNFTDMKLMRDRVVNKTFCEPFSEEE